MPNGFNFIIKNGEIVGVAIGNYDSLLSHPSINNTELAQAVNYSSEDLNIIKTMSLDDYNALTTHNPDTYYIVYTELGTVSDSINYLDLQNKPQINGVILTGNKSLGSLDLYSKEEVDNLLSSLSKQKVIPSIPQDPSTLDANTTYYVGTQAPYTVYLCDVNKNLTELGVFTTEFNEYQKKEDDTLTTGSKFIVGAINELNSELDDKAPLDSVYSKTYVNIDDAIMNPISTTTTGRQTYSRIFDIVDGFTDPISNTAMYGVCKTTITNYTPSTNTMFFYIEQEFTRIQLGSKDNIYKFRRTGSLSLTPVSYDLVANKANIVWKYWYPVEYPSQKILTELGANNYYAVSGGNCTISVNSASNYDADILDAYRVPGCLLNKLGGSMRRANALIWMYDKPLSNNITPFVILHENGKLNFYRMDTTTTDWGFQMTFPVGY